MRTVAGVVDVAEAMLFAGHLNSYQAGASSGEIPATSQLGEVIGMAASCLYLVQNGTWRAPNNSFIN